MFYDRSVALIESAKRTGLEPYRCLTKVLETEQALAQYNKNRAERITPRKTPEHACALQERGFLMKLKPHGYYLVDFVSQFVNGEISRFEFDLDYSGYVNEHFPYFQQEHPRLASRFADTIDVAYELGEHKSDESLRDSMADALDDFFSNRRNCDIF